MSSSVSVAFYTVATTSSIISLWLASSCDEIVIGGSTLCVVSSCQHTLASTRLTHISFSCGLSASVLFSVCVAVDLAVSVYLFSDSLFLLLLFLVTSCLRKRFFWKI